MSAGPTFVMANGVEDEVVGAVLDHAASPP
jgi:hypothetical protein